MPDAGEYETRSAPAAPATWGDAFAALPQDTPDTGGWQRMQACLPAPKRSRARWPLWLAAAASLLLMVAIPWRMLPQAEPDAPTSRASVAPVAAQSAIAATTPAVTPTVAIDAPSATMPIANRDRPHRATPSQRPIRTAAQAAGTTRIAATTARPAADLEPLYTQSAQLEGLLALARDDRVASGTAAALSSELDAQVADIDATLIQPGLSDAQRADLWGQRVDVLQQLVGIETTNRLYAARGQSYDAALVSID